jgi:hypothetical protein
LNIVKDPVSIVIESFRQSFTGIETPICIAIIDKDGLALETIGSCPDLIFLEGQGGAIVDSFEDLEKRFQTSFHEDIKLLILEMNDYFIQIFPIYNSKTELYLIARYNSITLIIEAFPYLKGIIRQIEELININERKE